MKTFIKMTIAFTAMILLAACGSNSTTNTEPSTPVTTFTSEILLGKTYTITDNTDSITVSFGETEASVNADGEMFTVSYEINEDGVLVIDGDDFHTFISMEENGNLNVENDGETSIWVLN